MSEWMPICPETVPRPIEEWNEEIGNSLWWAFPIKEPPYVGTPLDNEWENWDLGENFTHFTPIPIPQPPVN